MASPADLKQCPVGVEKGNDVGDVGAGCLATDLIETPPEGVRTLPEQFAVAAMVLKAVPRLAAAPPGLLRL